MNGIIKEIIQECLRYDPNERPSANEILRKLEKIYFF